MGSVSRTHYGASEPSEQRKVASHHTGMGRRLAWIRCGWRPMLLIGGTSQVAGNAPPFARRCGTPGRRADDRLERHAVVPVPTQICVAGVSHRARGQHDAE
jgi:hypothetical protein